MNIVDVSQEWDNQQIELLQKIYPTLKFKKWKILVQEFKKNGFSRNERELKLKWKYIHDTSNDHKKWTYEQLKILYKSVFIQGSNWSTIRKRLKGRSCMKLKNTFYSSMRKFLKKFYEDIFQNQNSNINKNIQILPCTCLKIFCAQEQYQQIDQMILQAFQSFGYCFTHSNFQKFKITNLQLYSRILMIIRQKFPNIFILKEISNENSQNQQQSCEQLGKISQIINLTNIKQKKSKDKDLEKDINFYQTQIHASYREIHIQSGYMDENGQIASKLQLNMQMQQNQENINHSQINMNNQQNQIQRYQQNYYYLYYLMNGFSNNMFMYNNQ